MNDAHDNAADDAAMLIRLRAVEYAQAIDTEVAALWNERERVSERAHNARLQLCWSVFDRPDGYRSRQPYWNISNEDLIERAREPHKREASYNAEARLKARAELRTAIDQTARINDRLNVLHDIWIQYAWPRFIECLSHDGHIHRWTGCSTLRITSRLGWHPELSGLNVEEAVDQLGPALCQVCYPEAKAEHKRMTLGQVAKERARGEREAAQAARDAVKNAKRLADSEVFRTRYGTDRVETVALCKELIRRPINEAAQLKWYCDPARKTDWQGSQEGLSNVIRNTTDFLAQMQADAVQATYVLLAREAAHEGWGATQAEIDKIIANATKKAAKDWA